MKTVFGIHIGNTNVSLAVCKQDGNTEMIVNDAGDRVTPAIVTITDEETIIGKVAKIAMASKWNTTICSNKRLQFMNRSDLEKLDHYNNIKTIMKDKEFHYCIPLAKKVKYITPKAITMCIFRKLYNTAKSTLNISEKNVYCVLLASETFTDEACKNYMATAEEAGWKVLQIINETAAAVLAYSLLEKKEPPRNILVYRLGGTTCEVVGYELSDGLLYTLGSERNEELGGHLFIEILTGYLADEFFRKYKLDARENRRSMAKLKLASENCVHILSNTQSANCFIESLQDGVDFSLNVSRARFELLIQPILAQFLHPLQLLLSKLDLNAPVDKVLLCGGTTNIPKMQSHIASLFDTSVNEILTKLNADEVFAQGAARQAYYLIGNKVTEVLPRSMIIQSNSPSECDSLVSHRPDKDN